MKQSKKHGRLDPKSKELTHAGQKPRTIRNVLVVALMLLVVAFLWVGGIVRFSNSMTEYYISSKRLDSAEWWLGVSRSVSSSDAHSEFLRARLYRHRGELDKMSNHLKAAHKLGFDPLRLEREQALASASIGRLSEDVEERLNLWLQEPNAEFSEIVDSYANGLTAVSRFDRALQLLQTWESNAPREPMANYRIARIHEHFYQTSEAEAQYRKAIEKDPTYRKATYHLARVLMGQRQPEEALKLFQSCNTGATALAAKTGLAGCYKILGETEKARTLLQDVLRFSYDQLLESYRSVDEIPERFVAASELGCIDTELGNYELAKQHLEIALKFHPLDSIARYSYAVALRGLGQKEEAEKNFEITRAARISLDQVSVLQELLRKNPEDTESRIKIGQIVLKHESERTGLFWTQSVFSYDPTNSKAHQAMADFFDSKVDQSPEDKQRALYHRSFVEKN